MYSSLNAQSLMFFMSPPTLCVRTSHLPPLAAVRHPLPSPQRQLLPIFVHRSPNETGCNQAVNRLHPVIVIGSGYRYENE